MIMADKKKILIIDDDPDIIKFLTVLLEDNGYSTIAAADGVEGLKSAQSERPDLILLDITMPEMSGVRFFREVRASAKLKSTPVVMVTGVAEDFKKFIHSRKQVAPPDGFIHKPIDKNNLLEIIAGLI